MILIEPPEELCFLLFDSLMIALVYEITAKSTEVEIPLHNTFMRVDKRLQFRLSGGFVTFLERFDTAAKLTLL